MLIILAVSWDVQFLQSASVNTSVVRSRSQSKERCFCFKSNAEHGQTMQPKWEKTGRQDETATETDASFHAREWETTNMWIFFTSVCFDICTDWAHKLHPDINVFLQLPKLNHSSMFPGTQPGKAHLQPILLLLRDLSRSKTAFNGSENKATWFYPTVIEL